jgi:hypothetical protein
MRWGGITFPRLQVLINAEIGKVKYWAELFRFPDKSGVDSLVGSISVIRSLRSFML